MYVVWHTLFNKNIREFKDAVEASAYCKYMNWLFYSKPNGASLENCFTVTETAF